jgi:hypothetical protein
VSVNDGGGDGRRTQMQARPPWRFAFRPGNRR